MRDRDWAGRHCMMISTCWTKDQTKWRCRTILDLHLAGLYVVSQWAQVDLDVLGQGCVLDLVFVPQDVFQHNTSDESHVRPFCR